MEESKFSKLDLSFSQSGKGYALTMRFLKSGEDAPREINAQEVQIDLSTLDEFDPEAYGKTLATQVFGPEKLRTTLGEWMAVSADSPLRIQIKTSPDVTNLHVIAWEKLRDPQSHSSFATSENTWFSRYPASQDRRPVVLRPKGALKALAVAANPSDLLKTLPPVDADAEIARAKKALGEIPARTLGNAGAPHATLENIFSALRDGVDVLYLACHGVLAESGPILFLEAENGKMARIQAEDFVRQLAELEASKLPRLIVLASCESAGKENAGSIFAFGPRLAEIGIPAVLAMQGKISMRTVEKFMPVFFAELNRDGQIDRALAVARGAVRERPDAWMPVLFLRSISGRLWDETRQDRFSADQVQALIGTIKTNFQPKAFTGDCPYVGLLPFEEENADLFFGRERLVEELLEKVQDNRGVFIAGPSGSGKSSLIRAGLIPALKKAENSKLWKYTTMKPGRNPLLELQRALERVAPTLGVIPASGQLSANWQDAAHQLLPPEHSQQFVQKAEALFSQVATDATRNALANLFAELGFAALQTSEPLAKLTHFENDALQNQAALHEAVEIILGDRRKQRLVLLIDQFEELFTQVDSEKIRQAFIQELQDAILRDDGRLVVILTMRSDFVPNFAAYPALNTMLNKFFFQVGLMTPEELVRSIVLPARHVNLEVEPSLVSQIINDMGDEPGALPLMQFALKDLFEAQKSAGNLSALTLEGYLQRGGIYKALERHANAVFAKLKPKQQELAQSIFVGLVEVGSGDQLTKRTALFSELVPPGADALVVEKVIRSLTDDRLLTTDTSGDKNTVTLAHEKLITAWDWLKKLANEKRTVIELNSEVMKDAENWDKSGRADDYLYRGAQLANVEEKLQAGLLTLSSLGLEFVRAGQNAYTNILEQEKKRVLHLEQLNKTALARQLVAQAQTLVTTRSSKQMLASLLSIQSMKLLPTPDAATMLLDHNNEAMPVSFMVHEGDVTSASFRQDGKRVVSCSTASLCVWETATGEEIFTIPNDLKIRTVAFSQDGNHLIARCLDLTGRLLDAATGKEIESISYADTGIDSSYPPQTPSSTAEKYIVFGSQDSAYIWDAKTGKKLARLFSGHMVLSVDVSPDGKYAVYGVGDDNTARIWDIDAQQEIACINHEYAVIAVAFSPLVSSDPNEMYIASGSMDGFARVWEAKSGKEIAHIRHEHMVTAIDFSPDGKYVVSGSNDFTMQIWDAKTGKEMVRVTHDHKVTAVGFSRDGKYLVSASLDGTARVCEIKPSKNIIRMSHQAGANVVAFSPDGKRIVSASDDYTARVWDAKTGQEVARMVHNEIVGHVAFSPNTLSGTGGKRVVSVSYDGVAYVWEAETGKEIARMTHPVDITKKSADESHPTDKPYIAFNPETLLGTGGKYVLSVCGDNNAYVWDAETGKEIARLPHELDVISAVFSPSGKYIASGSWDHTVRVWETQTWKEVVRVIRNSPQCVIFSPNSELIAVAYADGMSIIKTETGEEITLMGNESTFLKSLAFSPDSKRIVSGGDDCKARVWDIATGKEISRMAYDFYVYSVAFSPDAPSGTGGAYVVLGENNLVHICEADTGKEIARKTHDSFIHLVAFSPNTSSEIGGKFIASTSWDGAICVWAWQPDDLIKNASEVMPRNLTYAEWMQYIGDALPYQAVCEHLPLEPAPGDEGHLS